MDEGDDQRDVLGAVTLVDVENGESEDGSASAMNCALHKYCEVSVSPRSQGNCAVVVVIVVAVAGAACVSCNEAGFDLETH